MLMVESMINNQVWHRFLCDSLCPFIANSVLLPSLRMMLIVLQALVQ